tara:strand:+ start:4301 stop:6253 length:1953 start_codon:yes stop_codon:yes gene_type:complete
MANLVNILVSADTTKAEGNFKKVTRAVAGVSLAVAGMAVALVKVGDEFTKASNNIRAGTGATGKELEALKEEFRDVAGSVPQDFQTVSTAIADVNTKLGLSGDELEKTTKQFLDLSRVTGTEVTPLITTVSNSMQMFGLEADQATLAMAMFTKASQETGVPINRLTSRVEEFSPVLRNLGLEMSDSVAFLAQLEGAGISASRVMPGLNASMRRLANSGVTDMQEALEMEMRAIKDAVTDTEALNLATNLFGAEGAQRMSVAIRDGVVDFEDLASALEDSEDDLTGLTENTLTAGESFDIWKSKVKLMVEPLASVLSSIAPIVILLPGMIAGISALAGITAVQTAATWLWTAAQTALNFALSPIGLIILGIVAAVAAAIIIWKNWDRIVATLTATWEKLDSFMSDKFGTTWETIKEVVGGVITYWTEVFNGFIALFKGDWDDAKEHFGNALEALKGVFKTVFDAIWTFFDNWMTDKFGGKWEAVKDTVQTVVDFVADLFDGLWTTLSGIWDLIVGIFTGDEDKIKEGFKGIVNGIIKMVNAVIELFNKIKFEIPDWMPGLGGKGFSINIPKIPELAEGGIVTRPTLAMIGEGQGAEAVVPLNKAHGFGGVTVNVNMPDGGTVILDDESTAQRFGDFITNQVREALRTQGAF